ncbi:putative BSD domain-containing protein [Helianthus annuus]|nr:putative BSD domain-containing protein [Helianthus annuus]
MNFFQSVFSDDPEPSTPQPEPQTPENPNPSIPSITSAWTFGNNLIKTLASKSDSVIQTYRRDLNDFTSGIKQETAVIREAAVKAVNNLPSSLEAGAGFAQNSLESVGQAIDDIGATVTDIITHGKDSILAVDYSDSDNNNNIIDDSKRISNGSSSVDLGFPKPYSRLDAQIRTIQSDMNTYLNEPEDVVEFNEWKLGFDVGEKVQEIDDVMKENDGVVGEIYREIVPARVDESSFWIRYFYRVNKVKKAEEARVRLVRRAIAGEDDEELSWDVDEDEYEENAEETETETKILEKKDYEKKGVSESKNEDQNEAEAHKLEANSDVKTASEVKTDRDSDISIVSSQPSPEEDGWDEIEDIGSSDENKDKTVSRGSHGSADRAELRNRLSVADEEEDLTWDIEDDDETVKA